MLRIIVISLVVANLFLLAFQGSEPEAETENAAPKRVAGDPRIPTIHLFSEMMEDEDLLNGNRQCFAIGPFRSVEDRDEVLNSLLEVTSTIVERETQALVEKGYWVFMPPYVSLVEANQELLALKGLGLKDISIIYEGEWQNAISLGYFLRQANAQKRKSALEERGYKPMIRVQRQSETRYWLDYEVEPGAGLFSLDPEGRPNDFMQRRVPCPEEPMPVMASPASPQPFGELEVQEEVAADSTAEMENTDAGETAGAEDGPDETLQETGEGISESTDISEEAQNAEQAPAQPEANDPEVDDGESAPGLTDEPPETTGDTGTEQNPVEEPENPDGDGSGGD